MKLLIAVALAATSIPVLTTTAAAREDDSVSSQRRVCTQITVRAGSRMSGRRICRTPAEWRQALGADWRQLLAGYQGLEADNDLLQQRTMGNNDAGGQQGVPFSSTRQRGPQ